MGYEIIVTKVSMKQSTLTLTGETNLTTDSAKNMFLMVKKRGTKLIYHYPVVFNKNNNWTVEIDYNTHEFTKGIWDYYLEMDGQKFRLKVSQPQILENCNTLVYINHGRSHEAICYVTTKGSFSTKNKPAVMMLNDVNGESDHRGNVVLQGLINPEFKFKHHLASSLVFVLVDRKKGETHELPFQLIDKYGDHSARMLRVNLNFKDPIFQGNMETKRWNCYVKLVIDDVIHLLRVKVTNQDIKYSTRVDGESSTIFQVYFYPTTYNNLSIASTPLKVIRNLEHFCFNNETLQLSGYAYFDSINFDSENSVERCIEIREKASNKTIRFPLGNMQKPDLVNKFNDYSYSGFKVQISLNDILFLGDDKEKSYEFYVVLKYGNYIKTKRLGCEDRTFFVDKAYDIDSVKCKNKMIRSYLLFSRKSNLIMETYTYSKRKNKFLEKQRRVEMMPSSANHDVWLIGELTGTAQENGYHFFKFCRKHYPDKNIYYVIKKDSPDLHRVKKLGNVIIYGSMKHFRKASIATTFIGSHDLANILPTPGIDWPSYQTGKRIFLQHGILGRKNVHYYKQNYQYPFSMVCVSSNSEFELVKTKLGYNDDEVKITGLPRFDSLLNRPSEQNSILLIPTWRNWIKDDESFLESDFYKYYRDFLSDEKLLGLLKEYNVTLNFYIHYLMNHFTSHFEIMNSKRINIIKFGQQSVQDLLKQSKLMITDYSSVSFDFNYMEKPVIFYHFDVDKFFRSGSLRPLNETFVGDICENKNQLISTIEYYFKNKFREKEVFKDKKKHFISKIDSNNCKRIYDAINK
ncbi:CDP-glycerol glycerophosphotransferase family protein [Virgibacillus sp. NKC19-3]|uniref:CDP-glycerol glycerophosphotransferase family protein n=1 Tax=Virgibacillus saliphilus TaxID=2831674 RepID=UPI001C9AD45C|nr:CDP-glycerol glycerophosphotransferase family protein [Virgibacillus sp. NKC19-3]MBY7144658.1 CDP-glycerol glycerophosphotransferase family protein [Virgibacillus sp. NKC19-3]